MKGLEPMTQVAAGAMPTRRFAATRISHAIEADLLVPGGEGVVESLHRAAMNIRWRGRLVTLAPVSTGGLPNGILVHPELPLDRVGAAVGMAVQGDGTILSVPAASVQVSLVGAASWSPVMPIIDDLSLATRVRRGRRAFRLAAEYAPTIGLGPLLGGIADGRAPVGSLGRAAALSVVGVVDGLRQRSAERAATAAFSLIGLGPGATPSGDDLLVGLTAGLAAIHHPLAISFATGIGQHGDGLTTSLAEAYLAHAARLEFSERVHRAAVAVLTAREADLRLELLDALAWGASSGADLLVGLLIGIQADAPWLRPRLLACANEAGVAA